MRIEFIVNHYILFQSECSSDKVFKTLMLEALPKLWRALECVVSECGGEEMRTVNFQLRVGK